MVSDKCLSRLLAGQEPAGPGDLCCANTGEHLFPQRTSMHIRDGETFCSMVAKQLLKHFEISGHQSTVEVGLERRENVLVLMSSVKQWG